jgi:hypothetical protein
MLHLTSLTSVCGKVFFESLPLRVNMVFVAKTATATDAAAQLKNFGAKANKISGEKPFLAFSGAVALKLLVYCLNVLALNVALVGSEAAAESAGDMHQFVDEGFLFILR